MASHGVVAVAAAVFCVALTIAADAPHVHVLTDETFDDRTADGIWLVEFFAPWCGHCKHLAPVFEQAAANADGAVHFATVDATKETELKDRFDIDGFPTLKFKGAHSEEWTDYTGGRDIEHFDLFVNRMTGLPVTAVDSGKQLAEVMEAQAPEVVFALCSDDDHHIANTFYDTARDFQHRHTFVHIKDVSTCAVLSSDDVCVAKLEPGEDPVLLDDPKLTSSQLAIWVSRHQFPTVVPLGPLTFRELADVDKLLVVAVVHAADLDDPQSVSARLLSAVRTVARDKTGMGSQFMFGHLDATRWSKWVAQFLSGDQVPGVFVLDISNKHFYADPEVNEADELDSFLQRVLDGDVHAQRQGGSLYGFGNPFALIGVLVVLVVLVLMCFMRSPSDMDDVKRD